MISLLLLTWERYDYTIRCVTHNLANIGCDFELLVCDQGSKDKRVVEYIAGLGPVYHRLNSQNEGIAKSQNQLYLRSKGDVICLFPNDILLPDNWGKIAYDFVYKVPNAGLAGFQWGYKTPKISTKLGIDAHWITPQDNRVFGVVCFKRRVVEEIGFNHDEYGAYGLEDSDFNERINFAGFNSFYIPEVRSEHIGWEEEPWYRALKNEAMSKNAEIFSPRAANFNTKGIREPLPPMREPL